jgi:hypothetical protein
MLRPFSTVVVCLVVCASAGSARAQTIDGQVEEIEPRVVGGRGTTWVGFSGFVDRFLSPEDALPVNYAAQVDVCRFLTTRIAVRGAAVGTGQFGGGEAEDQSAGSGAPALHASGGVLYFLTPRSLLSAYLGGEYWGQLSRRAGRDLGSIIGTAGVQATISSRASLFIQAGYGVRLNRGDENELISRFVAQLGVRIRM